MGRRARRARRANDRPLITNISCRQTPTSSGYRHILKFTAKCDGSEHDIVLRGVDGLGDELLRALGGGEVVPVLDVVVEVEVLGPLQQFIHLLRLDVQVGHIQLAFDDIRLFVDGLGELPSLSLLLGGLHLFDDLNFLSLFPLCVDVAEPLEFGLPTSLLTMRCFLRYFSSLSCFLWW